MDIWPLLFLADGASSEEAEVILKVWILVKDVVAKPKVVTSQISGEVGTRR